MMGGNCREKVEGIDRNEVNSKGKETRLKVREDSKRAEKELTERKGVKRKT
jgi:hypothetical protein